MTLAVLGARPIERWDRSARQRPPAISNMLTPHMGDFARALPGAQDHL